MARDWHELFKTWSKPPTDSEEAKGSKAAEMITDALRSYAPLQERHFRVSATGSYRNNTNVRLDSDIDVAVVLTDAYYEAFPADGSVTSKMVGGTPAEYGLSEFREDVHTALANKFGRTGIVPRDKTFNVKESSHRLDADVTPFVLHRQYSGRMNNDGTWHYAEGAETRSRKDPGHRIINWHQQHYEEGVKRNDLTKRRFKRITRILKRLRNDMIMSGNTKIAVAAAPIPSFLIQCLVFNASAECFNREEGSYYEDVRETVRLLWNSTRDDVACTNYVEVSRMKSLFNPSQAWTRENAHEFLLKAWHHVGFK